MKKFLNSISADAKNLIFNLGGGIIWFLSILMTIVVGSNPLATSICKIAGGVALMIAAFLQFLGIIEEYHIKEDEMFIAHIKEAKARTLDIVVGGLIWYCVMATFLKIFFGFNFEHDWRALAFAVIGFAKLITFVFFRRLEKTGRSYL